MIAAGKNTSIGHPTMQHLVKLSTSQQNIILHIIRTLNNKFYDFKIILSY